MGARHMRNRDCVIGLYAKKEEDKGEWGRVGGELTPDCRSGGEVRSGGPTHFLFTIVELRVEPSVGRAELRADTKGKRTKN